jgi:hypothetical protein
MAIQALSAKKVQWPCPTRSALSAKKGGMAVLFLVSHQKDTRKGFWLFFPYFSTILLTPHKKIGDLYCHVHIFRISHGVCTN